MARTKRSGAAKSQGLVPLEKKLRKLRKREARQRQQLNGVHSKVEQTTDEMAGLLASLKAWTDNVEVESGSPQASPAPSSTGPRRTGLRRLIGPWRVALRPIAAPDPQGKAPFNPDRQRSKPGRDADDPLCSGQLCG